MKVMLAMISRWSVCLLLFCHLTSANPHWPAGAYGLPKPQAGCPGGTGFKWADGWVLQDTVEETNHAKSSSFHLKADLNGNIKRYFCVKTSDGPGVTRGVWPRGQYCIYRKGGTCPAGLSSGSVYWDDENWWNVNKRSGELPDGTYNRNTRIQFCCSTETGLRDTPILLPTTHPFFLLAYSSASCQQVKWALGSLEWLTFDTHDGSIACGKYPFGASLKNPTIHYCYYKSCNYTHTASSGSFQSPNHPNPYPNGQWCSWRIAVDSGFVVTLQFTSFNLEKMINTDQVLVHDGQNESSLQLGTFYGGSLPPKKGIQSSSNNMFVIFKSDELHNSFTGFKANYFAVARPSLLPTSVATLSGVPPAVTEYSNDVTPTLVASTHLRSASSSGHIGAMTMTPTLRLQPLSTIDSNDNETQKSTVEPTVITLATSYIPSEESLESNKEKLRNDGEDSRAAITVGLSLLFVTIVVAIVTAVIWRIRKKTLQKKKTSQTMNSTVIYNSVRTINNPTYSTIKESTAVQDANPYEVCNLESKEKSSDNPLYDSRNLDWVQDNPMYESSSSHYETIPIV